ncbi:hypothetical protein S7711_05470 [Stachybotrys chartarum IBT 7711]|uniref:Zn(2)-C6 fungal-type domain-containing protein n=1 Tax=Stachybotrys chartarum (strain CBS 109288 / IBT 7711) TaxID=1280523 RepID=A0A084BAZ2_STACB|nr:hypothetical protein S7711_05470 [Stachybotrys chartarum IBT 7711]
MRTSLRRSCEACARAKHGCDLRTPQCSRCVKRRTNCVYANEPLTASASLPRGAAKEESSAGIIVVKTNRDVSPTTSQASRQGSMGLISPIDASIDPFDSYPATRLPRPRVQRLIHHCEFEKRIRQSRYYPLDLSHQSNPFVVSWWPRALADPALFHVSLQTASLDEELRAQQGFPISEMLMADSVSLIRQTISNPALAYRDETLNSVVTLAAIEHGQGNYETVSIHVDGMKQLVAVRGGLGEIRRTSPLTARMVPWVCLLVTGSPQFPAQNNDGFGNGIQPTAQWQLSAHQPAATSLGTIPHGLDVCPEMSDVLMRLRSIFQSSALTNTEIHDLTCYVVHKLLLMAQPSHTDATRLAVFECLRYGIVLYMLIIHGTTYYSHDALAHAIIPKLQTHLEILADTEYLHSPIFVWTVSIALAAMPPFAEAHQEWFLTRARVMAISLGMTAWDQVASQLKAVLWINLPQQVAIQRQWDEVWGLLNGS